MGQAIRLEGKVVLITGGRRVGAALADLLAQHGARLAMTYHTSKAAIEQTVAGVRSRGVDAVAVQADLTKAEEAERAVHEVAALFGRIDVLVNMASLYRRIPFLELTAQEFDRQIAANLAAPYYTSAAAARAMLAQPAEDGIKGKIINFGDWASERPYKNYLPYLVGKGGLATMTLALARELAPHIPVVMIQPAMIDPPPDFTAADIKEVEALTPLRRVGSPDDVNRLILYLLEGTNFVTGACYRVDGGRFLGQDG